MDKTIKTKTIMHKAGGEVFNNTQNVLVEKTVLLSIIREGETLNLKVVCTDSYVKEMVVGRLLTDGMIHNKADIVRIEMDDSSDSKVIKTAIKTASKKHSKRSDYVSYDEKDIWKLIEAFEKGSELHNLTKSAHSCYLLHNSEIVFECEDISRHNAVDKTIGYMLLNDINPNECILYTSGRVPLDMIEKIDKAGIPVLVAKAVPTNRSIQFAKEKKIVLIARARKDSYEVFI